MTLSSKQLIEKLQTNPTSISFQETIETIDSEYEFSPVAFTNGSQENAANENNGSCKILSFAKLHNLSKEQTLELFGDFYRKDVVLNPTKEDHQNIRQFMIHGWDGVIFTKAALK